MAETRIGISGWRYAPWRGVFYPKGLPQKRELEFASREFNSVEINGSFYSLQRPTSYQQWYAATPDDFVFSVKGGRFITHMKKLNDVDDALANFFASGLLALKEKLGPILWQFPPNFGFDADRFERFFQKIPFTFAAAAKLAKKHTDQVKGRAYTKSDDDSRVIRHAVEIRHPTFCDPQFVDLLRKYNVAAVFADTAQRWPYFEDVTADFVYCRLHGDTELYVSGYTDSALDWWADRIRLWRAGKEPADSTRIGPRARARKSRDVYVYFDNDAKVRAPFDALALARRVTPSPARTPTAIDPQREVGEEARASWPVAARRKR
jgi:uncharacterized protein YecE (DUF72 family)